MKFFKMSSVLILSLSFLAVPSLAKSTASVSAKGFYDLQVKNIEGKPFNLSDLKGKVTLVVNTASQCGFTPQLKDLEELNKKYARKGLQVLGFPSNDFRQDQGSNSEIASFAQNEYKITFPLMEKNPVTGDSIQPAYKFLTEAKSGVLFKAVQWNFEKFLVDKKGQVVERWSSVTKPLSADVVKRIEEELAR
jgi:glutathione peroxidase